MSIEDLEEIRQEHESWLGEDRSSHLRKYFPR